MKRKLGINADCIVGADSVTTIGSIAAAGFDSTFSSDCDLKTVESLKNECVKLGVDLEFLHAPFANINEMWLEGDGYKKIYDGMKQSITCASKCGIKAIIAHLSSGWHAPEICDLGLKRYDEIVEFAQKNNVIVAFENLRKVGNVAYFVDRYEHNDSVYFCYDVGHEHCYTVTVDFPDIFRDKMMFTHVHDNLGRDKNNLYGDPDMHVLPFDGNIDYVSVMRKLDKHDYKGSLMLEVSSAPYKDKSPIEFVFDAYARIKKISEL